MPSATVGSVTFSPATPPSDDNSLAIGALGVDGVNDWYPPTPGNDIVLGFESLQVQVVDSIFALGFDFVEPAATVQPWGGTPVDSTYEVTLFLGTTEVGHFTFNAPDDELAFVGVWSDTAFDRVTITDATGDSDDEYFGEFYTGVDALPCTDGMCMLEDKEAFLAATGATAATGVDGNGDPLPLPDLGDMHGTATIGEVTFRGPQVTVGTRGISGVANNDWTLLLPGPDIALTGPEPVKRLEVRFARPVYAAGFAYVEPQTGPNVGRRFSDATFTVELKAGNRTVQQLAFNGPNDIATFIGVWTDVAFDRLEIRSNDAFGTKLFSTFFRGETSLLIRRPDSLVADPDAGTNFRGALFRVDAVSGNRTVLTDFGNALQGQPGASPLDVSVEADGKILVLDPSGGTNFKGMLFRVDPVTGQRLPLSDFGATNKGPLGDFPSGVAVEANGNILVVDAEAGTNRKGMLFRVNPVTGQRSVVSDFGAGANQGVDPAGVAVEANGNILVVDFNAGTNKRGILFRVNPGNGSRTVVSDFGSFTFGPLGVFTLDVAVEANGNILVVDAEAGTNSSGLLFRLDRTTGVRTPLSDFGAGSQGSLGGEPTSVAVEANGDILVVDPAGSGSNGDLFRVDPVNGTRVRLSRFGNSAQGPRGVVPVGVAVMKQ